MADECLIALPATIATVTQVRSTLLQSSLNTLRTRGHFERYQAALDPRHKETILSSLAPEWLGLDVAIAHYQACESLRLPDGELLAIGEDVGNRIQGTLIGTMVRRARTIGLTPWLVLGQFQRLWERLMMGGGVALYKKAPKDAFVDIRQLPLARYAYFRAAFCGVIGSAIKLGAGRAVVVKVGETRGFESRITFKAAWV